MRIIAAILAVCLLLVGLDGFRTWQVRQDVIAADRVETANLARSLAQQAHDSFYVIDVILTWARERVETPGSKPEPGQLDQMNRVIGQRLREMPALCNLAILDAAGHLVAGRKEAGSAGSDPAYLAYHSTHADRGLHIGDIARSCGDGQWSLSMSRRIDDERGRFAGVVQAGISIGSLQRFYGGFSVGPHGLIALVTRHGSVVARTDGTGAGAGAPSAGPVHDFGDGKTADSVRDLSSSDGIVRLSSVRMVDDYPFYVIVSHAYDEVLEGWRISAWLHVTVTLLASGLLVLTGSRVAGQVRIRQQVERRYRLLADNLIDAVVCVSLDGSRRYASPAFTVLTGWSIDEILVPCATDIIHPDDWPCLAATTQKLLAGAPQATACFRYICKDGSLLWVETRARLLRCDDGEMQVISNVRDVSDRRAAEDRVAMLNRELAELARTDGLTGVANRRRFDEALAQEWQRARHEEAPVSLMMIDVDRFKLFNDRYGHLRGDECLRAVAAVVAQVARGPAALTARYGGEEFVVLLPRIDATAAAALAERVLAAVRAMAIEHLDNGAVVTVSIGIAAAMPWTAGFEACDETTLIADADAALYEAKRSGRDRAVPHDRMPIADSRSGPPDRRAQPAQADGVRSTLPASAGP